MAVSVNEIVTPDKKGLRSFALSTAGIVAVLFGLFFPWLLEVKFPLWPWVLAGVLAVWGLALPGTLGPVYRGWMRLGLVLNWISSRIVLGFVFYVLITPIGLAMRLMGKDPMHREFKLEGQTYRVLSQQRTPRHMDKPF
jgi:hypothetical protein